MMGLLLWLAAAAHGATPIRAGFNEALDKIVQRNTVVIRQSEVTEATRAKYISTGALLWLPAISVQAKAGSDRDTGVTTARRSVEGVADLNIFRFGADLAASKAANRDVESQERLLLNTILSAEAEGVSALVNFIQSQRQLEVSRHILSTRKEALVVARRRYEKGQFASEEVDKVSVDLDNATAQMRDAESALVQASTELERLLGEPEVAPEWPWKDSLPKSAQPLLKLANVDLSARPDWQAASSSVELAEQRSKEAFGDMLPRLDARASYGYFSNEVLGVRTTGPAWTAGLSLTIPLFDRLAGYGRYQAQVHSKAAAEADWEGIKRNARKEWSAAKSTLAISLDTALAREKTQALARKLYQANLERFNRGILSANEFRIDQDRLYETEIFVLKGWAAVHNDYRRLCHALGRRVEKCADAQ